MFREWNFGVRVQDEILGHAINVFGNDRIVDELCLSVYFSSKLAPQRYFLLGGHAHFGDQPMVEISFPDHGRIFINSEGLGIAFWPNSSVVRFRVTRLGLLLFDASLRTNARHSDQVDH